MNLESPCTRVCTLDLETGLCIGCMRTMDEISRWVSYSDAQRDAIRKELPLRRPKWAQVACASCGAAFACGAADRDNPCWCVRYPPVQPSGEAGCLCAACLRAGAREARG